MTFDQKLVAIVFVFLISYNTILVNKGEDQSKYPQTRLHLNSYDGSTSINSVHYSPGGDLFAIELQIDGIHKLRIADSTTLVTKEEMEGDFSRPISWSPDGKYIAIKYNISEVAIIDTTIFEVINVLYPNQSELHTSDAEVKDIEWSHFGDLLAIGRGFGSGSLQIWNFSSGYTTPLKILDVDVNVSYLSFKSDSTMLVIGGNINNITFWDLTTFTQIRSFMVGEYNGFIDWAPNSDLLVLGGDNNFHIYDFATDEFVKRNIINVATSAINFALWSKNSAYIAFSYREDPYSANNNVLKILDYNENDVVYIEHWGENGRLISWHPSSDRFAMTDRISVIVVSFEQDITTLGERENPLNLNISMLILTLLVAYRVKRKNIENYNTI